MSNVKLAIRVRPFTDRELRSDKERIPVVDVLDANTVTITNIKAITTATAHIIDYACKASLKLFGIITFLPRRQVSLSGAGDSRERVRRYYADYTFDSASPVTHPAYASQGKVFETIGRDVVQSVRQGSSTCVLAYGQSATGKTHTMIGTETQPGLVPRLCTALADEEEFSATVSFLEIYNERVHDLLAGEPLPTCNSLPRRRGNARKDLRVREHPSRGPYVQNLRRVEVKDINDLLALVEEGIRRRRTAATRRNATSSRSHALLELATSRATLHLVDLAGSEKASWEGCGGGRQKEGANINKSLVALSNVISALVSGGNGRGKFVPYRDSALTWLLKDCFTGGANAFIIATVSPSVACYGESASTLRWAERARQLPTPRLPNSGVGPPTKSALQAQLNQLLSELARQFIRYIPETGKLTYEDDHWKLHLNKSNRSFEEVETSPKIGNIMNMHRPKSENQNSHSESTASSVASGSSDVINTIDKNPEISSEIQKEVDEIFGPALERAKSGSDLKIIAPVRHKKRQYKSQEVLPIVQHKHLDIDRNGKYSSQNNVNGEQANENDKEKCHPVPIIYDNNQRAEIVASVTERLYTKLKKKEEAAVSKMDSIIDRKIMEPLSELRICTNARQRLMDISQRAMRNKRRIGIPAYTQTKRNVVRVKDQATDVQTDLESYVIKINSSFRLQHDVGTETIPITPRCKEIAVGPQFGSLFHHDRSTITEFKPVIHKSSFVMTESSEKCDNCTQTLIVPPPRRKKRVPAFTKSRRSNTISNILPVESPVININISQSYPDTESPSSDDSLEKQVTQTAASSLLAMQPDLLSNHSTTDVLTQDNENLTAECTQVNHQDIIPITKKHLQHRESEDFPDSDEFSLPRVTIANANKVTHQDLRAMILGRNENTYPYNIVLSPPKERESNKRLVKFKDFEDHSDSDNVKTATTYCADNKANDQCHFEYQSSEKESDCYQFMESNASSNSDCTDASKAASGSFIWTGFNPCSKRMRFVKPCTPVYQNKPKYGTAKAKVYKEFLGLERDITNESYKICCPQCTLKNSYKDAGCDVVDLGSKSKFIENRKFFEGIFNRDYGDHDTSYNDDREVLRACNSLESAINKYEGYLKKFNRKAQEGTEVTYRTRPKDYLHHLVQIRREMVKTDCESSDSSMVIFKK